VLKALHVGCGGERLPPFIRGLFSEYRCDVDPAHSPDIVADARDLGDIGRFDFLYSVHMLEHFHAHDVPVVLSEFKRVTTGGGAVCVIVPNTEGVSPTDDVLYLSPAGPITGRDVLYGKQDFVEKNPWMAHHVAFTAESLKDAMEAAGFYDVKVTADKSFNLIAGARSP
jgi:ubiquinone/menaquinone biosynthesis C-methylase UbiE